MLVISPRSPVYFGWVGEVIIEMTSVFALNQRLEQSTLDAYSHSNASPEDIEAKVNFFSLYLQNVAPLGITVFHVPVGPDDGGQTPDRYPVREEILLKTNGQQISMSGLVSLEYQNTFLERTAGEEAYINWLNGDFTPDGGNWRLFIGHNKNFQFFASHNKDGWVEDGKFSLMQQVEEVAAYLQKEFNKLPA